MFCRWGVAVWAAYQRFSHSSVVFYLTCVEIIVCYQPHMVAGAILRYPKFEYVSNPFESPECEVLFWRLAFWRSKWDLARPGTHYRKRKPQLHQETWRAWGNTRQPLTWLQACLHKIMSQKFHSQQSPAASATCGITFRKADSFWSWLCAFNSTLWIRLLLWIWSALVMSSNTLSSWFAKASIIRDLSGL